MRRITSKSYDNERRNGSCRCIRSKREVSAELIENLEPGDYVMVHAGIAIERLQKKMRMRQKIFWRGYYERTIKKKQKQLLKAMMVLLSV